MTFTILVVCSANVCRSPMTVAVLRRGLADSDLDDSISLTSCGEHAWTNLAACDEVSGDELLAPDEVERLHRHRPIQLTRGLAEQANLILTADRSIRSSVVRLVPGAHARTFTVREGALLASHALTSALIPAQPSTYDAMRWLTTEMNDSRGLTRMPGIARYRRTFLPWPRLAVHSHDIPDAHGDTPVPHRVVRDLILSATDVLSRSFMHSAQRAPERRRP